MTWAELLDIIRDYGFARDEYFDASFDDDMDIYFDGEIWDEHTRWVSAFWVVGNSEGYYVHVERISTERQRSLMLLGKFWDWQRAQAAVNFIQYVVNFERIPADVFIPERND